MPVLLSPVLPCTSGWNLLGRGLFGSFLDSSTLPSASQRLVWGFPQPPELALYVVRLVRSSFGSVGPQSVLHGLYVLQRFVCMPLLAPWTHPLHWWVSVGFSQFPKPAVWSGLQYVSCLWAEKCSFLCFMLSGSLLHPASRDSTAPPWASFARELSSAWELFLLQDSFPPSGHKLPYISSQSFPFICLHPLSYLISGSLAVPPGGLASSAVS